MNIITVHDHRHVADLQFRKISFVSILFYRAKSDRRLARLQRFFQRKTHRPQCPRTPRVLPDWLRNRRIIPLHRLRELHDLHITYLKEKFRITDTIKQKIRVILSFPLSVIPHIMLRPDHLKQIRLSRPCFSNKNMQVVRFPVSTDDRGRG